MEFLNKCVPMWSALTMTLGVIGGMSKKPAIQWTMVCLILILCGWALFN